MQFPSWLARGEAARRRIAELATRCRPWRAAVELRHASCFDGEAVFHGHSTAWAGHLAGLLTVHTVSS
ncbi:hypothetical protein [Micromonospora endophytica]|uniref:hypothetical protein n=1 Tax=Micromonospora endophytica TaxID=515350 RepID=UPI001C32C9F3|nr:hypothetical protein [Micromonospora endophytica]BCJ57512.1 hypothetical protein Jiend_09340 [Micromonospora endophytica]